MVPDGLDAEVLCTAADQVGISQLMTRSRRVYEEGRSDLTFTGQYQHPRVYALSVQHIGWCFLQLLVTTYHRLLSAIKHCLYCVELLIHVLVQSYSD